MDVELVLQALSDPEATVVMGAKRHERPRETAAVTPSGVVVASPRPSEADRDRT